jgi:hypothetical protein
LALVEDVSMSLWAVAVRDLRPRAIAERRRLIEFVEGLTPGEWLAPTAAAPWTVKDLALHILDDDLRWLSHRRDHDESGLIDMSVPEAFVELLAANNQRWVQGAQALSRRVVSELLEWTGQRVAEYHADQDMRGQGWVSWASSEPVPFWFNLAQEFTERWVHQQQMRDAVGRTGNHDGDLPDVLATFVWAFPHQYRADSPAGARVVLTFEGIGTWTLTADAARRWSLIAGGADGADATLSLSSSAAWRLLTGASSSADEMRATGPPALVKPLLRVRAIIV